MQVRGMKSVNTRVKRPMHITRAKLMELTKYKRPKDLRSMAEQCSMRYKGERIQEVYIYKVLVRIFYRVSKFAANLKTVCPNCSYTRFICRADIIGCPI